jgi:hypothetical protein
MDSNSCCPFDAANRMTGQTNSIDGSVAYDQDNAGQLIAADSTGSPPDEGYSYDGKI